jgi:hypothetical protein
MRLANRFLGGTPRARTIGRHSSRNPPLSQIKSPGIGAADERRRSRKGGKNRE